MKKFLSVLFAAAFVGLMFAGCAKVSPTEVTFKYNVTIKGEATYKHNDNPCEKFSFILHVSGAPVSTYVVTTDRDGVFSIDIPCLTKAGITLSSVNLPDSYGTDGFKGFLWTLDAVSSVTIKPDDTEKVKISVVKGKAVDED